METLDLHHVANHTDHSPGATGAAPSLDRVAQCLTLFGSVDGAPCSVTLTGCTIHQAAEKAHTQTLLLDKERQTDTHIHTQSHSLNHTQSLVVTDVEAIHIFVCCVGRCTIWMLLLCCLYCKQKERGITHSSCSLPLSAVFLHFCSLLWRLAHFPSLCSQDA